MQTCLTWISNLSFSSVSNPKYFATGVLLIFSPRIVEVNVLALIFLREKSIKLVLDIFKVSLFEVSHLLIILASLLAVLFNLSQLLLLIIIIVSSANSLTLDSVNLRRSLSHTENKVGPRIDPWGTPHVTFCLLEAIPLTHTN